MSKTGRINYRRGERGMPKAARRLRVRTVPHKETDLRKLSRALFAIALAEVQRVSPPRGTAQENHHDA